MAEEKDLTEAQATPTREQGEEIAQNLQRKLELLATVTLLSTNAVLRVLEQRRPGSVLRPEEWQKLQELRSDVQRAIDAIDKAEAEDEMDIVDLSGVRERLQEILDRVDRWPPPDDDTAPS